VIACPSLGNNEEMGDFSAAVDGAISIAEARRPLDARSLVLFHFNFAWRLLRRLGVDAAAVDDAAQKVFFI
jgi:hypothetical protein